LGKIPSPKEVVFTNTPDEDNLQNIFQDNFYMYDSVNGLLAKIVLPKKVKRGVTGLYIPDLKDGNSFSIYARSLDSVSQGKALQMFQTIKYK
jgi:hypothetical protein